jgi:hypothetical protein
MPRARSRKRRPHGGRAAGHRGVAPGDAVPRAQGDGERPAQAQVSERVNGRPRGAAAQAAATAPRAGRSRSSPTASTFGEPPHSPWHPLPLSELLILAGAVGTVIGMKHLGEALSNGAPTLLVGLAAVGIGTIEVTLREHRSGYRSHTVLLALLPVLVLDSLIVLGISAFVTPPRLLTVGLIAIDMAVFALLFKVLRARFLEARHARVIKEG